MILIFKDFFLLASTAHHANELGFRTILIEDASRGINNVDISNAFDKIRSEHGCVVKGIFDDYCQAQANQTLALAEPEARHYQ